jgi:DNA repair protein RadC
MKRIDIYSVKQVKEKSGVYNLNNKKISSAKDANTIIQTVLDLNNESVEKFGILGVCPTEQGNPCPAAKLV